MSTAQEQTLQLDDIMPLIEERLAAGQSVEFSPHGVSMLPMLREGRDSVILSAPPARLKKYDIPLYRRPNGSYVLHRVVAVGDGVYTAVGDNQFIPEKGIPHEAVIACLTAYRRGGKLIPANALGYRIYSRFWHLTRPVRYFFFRLKRKTKHILHRLFK